MDLPEPQNPEPMQTFNFLQLRQMFSNMRIKVIKDGFQSAGYASGSTGWKITAIEGIQAANYTVATLPTGLSKGFIMFATNGRKVGEGAGAGTGTLVYWDNVAWRRVGDDTTVAA